MKTASTSFLSKINASKTAASAKKALKNLFNLNAVSMKTIRRGIRDAVRKGVSLSNAKEICNLV